MKATKSSFCTNPRSSHVFCLIFNPGHIVHYWENQTWQYNKSEPHTKLCLVIRVVEFHQCGYVGDLISKTQNGS